MGAATVAAEAAEEAEGAAATEAAAEAAEAAEGAAATGGGRGAGEKVSLLMTHDPCYVQAMVGQSARAAIL